MISRDLPRQVLELAHLSKEEVNAQLLALRHSARQMTLSLAHYANKVPR